MRGRKFLYKIIPFFAIILLQLPVFVFAQDKIGITNPLGNTNDITGVLKNVINWMLGLVGLLALIALIVGGGRMIVDFGNEEQVKKAKTTILYAVIGLAVVILSYAIINIVVSDILGGETDSSPGNQYNQTFDPNL